MAQLEVLRYPDPRLTRLSSPVAELSAEHLQFIQSLEQTMRGGPPSVGIAAPQVGRLERIVIVDCSFKSKIKHHGRMVLINPEILDSEGSVLGREGCLSVPDFTGNVLRAETIKLKFRDETFQNVVLDLEGFEARAVQHEIDHLDGLLFLDRVTSRQDVFKRKVYK